MAGRTNMGPGLALVACLLLALLNSDCVNALRPRSQQTEVQLKVAVEQPQACSIRVGVEPAADYPVPANGRVNFIVPSFSNGCDSYLFGLLKIRDGAAENVRIIELQRNHWKLRKLSLAQIAKLPKDDAGYSVVKIED